MLFVLVLFGLFTSVNSRPPQPIVTVEEKQIPVKQGSYCWETWLRGTCVDMISPSDMVSNVQPVVVAPGAEVSITFKQEPNKNTLGVNLWKEEAPVDVALTENKTFQVPQEKGVYIYSCFAYWDQGSSSYVFVVEVK